MNGKYQLSLAWVLVLVSHVLVAAPGAWAQYNSLEFQLQSAYQRVVALSERGQWAEAIPNCEEALELAQRAYGSRDPKAAALLNHLAMLYVKQSRYTEAEHLLRR